MYVALLRGINVGGKHKLPMKDLVAIFQAAGCESVRNYIQSGNIVFSADAALAGQIPDVVGAAVEERFGFRPPMLVRSAAELEALVRDNPFVAEGADENSLHVVFLADPPDPDRVAALDPDRSPPDRFAVVGSSIYLHCPNGLAKSKITNAWLDSRLRTMSTGRNWRTVNTLLEMAR
ncbi:MAG: DUF1697 domain-containing protein [Acidobacteria bacterium]|nr:DUF1697 domain-containing protein [Acidobacteriota bacterium]